MRILLLAPRNKALPELNGAATEVQEIVNTPGLDVTLLQGNKVTEDALARALAGDDKFDMLWIASHSGEDGVVLSSEVLAPKTLAFYVRNANIRNVFLNSCASITIANLISQEAGANVIGSISDVTDAEALRTATSFARYLGQLRDPRSAFDRSRPLHNINYVYIAGTPTTAAVDYAVNMTSDLSLRLDKVETKVDRIWALLHPSSQRIVSWTIVGLVIATLWSSWLIKEVRDYYLRAYPVAIGIFVLALVLIALVIWLPDEG